MPIQAYAALEAKQALQSFQYEPKPLGANQVEIKITHCGICHSDVHLIDNDWQTNQYPLIPGHEVIGEISALGANVDQFQLGQRVGIGWQCYSCGNCEWCVRAEENMCSKQQATCIGNYGGFATFIRVDQRFAFLIPSELPSAQAAPLLCGGITVYSPIRQHVTNPNMNVGIVGIGGLGHMALQFAHAFGCEVTAFSSTPSKAAEAKQFGADHFIDNSDSATLAKLRNSLDFILVTVAAPLNWLDYVNMLRPRGKLCFLSGLTSPVNIPIRSLISGRKSVWGSNIGNRFEIREMLSFAARHKLGAKVEVMAMKDVNAALEKVRGNKARYRMVVENG